MPNAGISCGRAADHPLLAVVRPRHHELPPYGTIHVAYFARLGFSFPRVVSRSTAAKVNFTLSL
jgi:hypothetical protein